MKGNLKKLTGFLTAAVLTAGIIPSAMAGTTYEENYNGLTGTMNLADSGKVGDKTGAVSYTEALSGKESGNYALTASANDVSNSAGASLAFEVPYYAWSPNHETKEYRTLEISMKFNDEADYAGVQCNLSSYPTAWKWDKLVDFVKFEKGSIFVTGKDTGLKYKPGEWYRIAIQEHYSTANLKVFINGNEYAPDISGWGYILGNKWTKAVAGINGGGGTRNIELSIDDVKIYNGEYTPSDDAKVSYEITDGTLNYDASLKAFLVDETVTVENVLAGISTGNTKYVIDSLSGNKVKESGNVSNGNVVVIKSADGGTVEYIHIYTDPELIHSSRILMENGYAADSNYSIYQDEANYSSKANVTGVYGKDASDYSYACVSSGVPAEKALSDRFNFTSNDGFAFSSDAFTYEFSVGGDGDIDSIGFLNYNYLSYRELDEASGEYTEKTDKVYTSPLKLYADGRIVVNEHTTLTDMTFRKNQWYRVAITYYPKECKYDLYINGVKVADKEWASSNDKYFDSEKYDLSGFYWFQLQTSYSAKASGAERQGRAVVDDIASYLGTYYDDPGNRAVLESDSFTVDEVNENIYIPENTDVSAVADSISYGEAAIGLFTDNTYQTPCDSFVSSGNVIVLTSPNGKVFKYYMVQSPEFKIDEEITLYVNDEMTNILEPGELTAKINVYSPENRKLGGLLILAVYENGALKNIYTDEKAISGDTAFSASAAIETTDNITARAMFMDSFGTIKPYIPAASYVTIQ